VKHLSLREWKPSRAVELSVEERDSLLRNIPGLAISPSPGATGYYDIVAGSTVGIAVVDGMTVEIRPKIEIERLMFMISFAIDPKRWREDLVAYERAPEVFEAMLPAYASHLRRATRRGLLSGYRTFDELLSTVRGRIRINDQIRRHYDLPIPVEVRYDDYTIQIPENHLIRSALASLRRMPIRSERLRASLRAFERTFAEVDLVDYGSLPLPDVHYTRLNEHYRPAVELSKLILRSFSYELGQRDVTGVGFLVDMNHLFEDFVVVALRDALGLSATELRQSRRGLFLDTRHRVPLKPDIAWWHRSRCEAVADAKYKRTDAGIPNADIYQLLAYTTASRLPGGILIYAKGERNPDVIHVVHADKEIHILALDLDVPPSEVLAQIGEIARLLESLRDRGRRVLDLAA
jgi:5-methylcytosine-specific restriction enzyme subunit McrC